MKKNAFPKRFRLLGNNQFKAVIEQRHRIANSVLVLYFAPNALEFSRIGITLGKSAGTAVARNRFKRLVREVFRLNRTQIPAGFDLVIKKQKGPGKPGSDEVKNSFLNLSKKIK